ncbi:heavy-metal-associated domain-containing protein [Devosia ginsengisoli]|uniref:Heavy-metal-associated domain-containing protein n=1 Tax=Devosia ginsengisoli TaxID=400770 RepID=A0A5B8LN52_9HYPH|nr:heavy-metal-associated domain-containing protein [Devosia ginsengisoli]QDZ09563.1 heavy-metal-associated domain-containing protein [Devosia ginsengisoli]
MSDKTILTVNDMTCGHCVGTVRKALQDALPGADISVDLTTHKVEFTGDRATGEAAIREAGYTPEAA